MISELITHRHPVAPVLEGLARIGADFQRIQLRQRHPQPAAGKLDAHEYLARAVDLLAHRDHRHLLALFQGRDGAGCDAADLEGERQVLVEVVVPAVGALLGV